MFKKVVSLCLLGALLAPYSVHANPEGKDNEIQKKSRFETWAKRGVKGGLVSGACWGFIYGAQKGLQIQKGLRNLEFNSRNEPRTGFKSFSYSVSKHSPLYKENRSDYCHQAKYVHIREKHLNCHAEKPCTQKEYFDRDTILIETLPFAFVPACGAIGGIVGGIAGGISGGMSAAVCAGALEASNCLTRLTCDASNAIAAQANSFYQSFKSYYQNFQNTRLENSQKKDEAEFLKKLEDFLANRKIWLSSDELNSYLEPKLVSWPQSGSTDPVWMSQYDLDRAYLLKRYKLDAKRAGFQNDELVRSYIQQSFESKDSIELSSDEAALIENYVNASKVQITSSTTEESESVESVDLIQDHFE